MREFFLVLPIATFFLATVFPVEAQQPAKVPRIGLLRARLAASGTSLEGFLREFRELGYVEGKNIAYEYRYGGFNDLGRLSALADELVSLEVDMLIIDERYDACP